MTFAQVLILGSALIALGLGLGHMMTFLAGALDPRDASLRQRLQEVSPVISRDLTMWQAYIGFNASHSVGALLFGFVYGYLALAQPSVLFGSRFLAATGFVTLAVYVLLAWRYWFRLPLLGTALALLLYAGGWLLAAA